MRGITTGGAAILTGWKEIGGEEEFEGKVIIGPELTIGVGVGGEVDAPEKAGVEKAPKSEVPVVDVSMDTHTGTEGITEEGKT